MALLWAGATASPVFIEVVKMGLLTAWAFGESILDVRALLAGKRIALLKSETTWTTELENLGTLSTGFSMSKESDWGLNYQEYLGLLLLFEEEQTLAMRSMNLQEATIRRMDGNSAFGMDQLVIEARARITYSYEPIFPFLQVLYSRNGWKRSISGTGKYGYYERQV